MNFIKSYFFILLPIIIINLILIVISLRDILKSNQYKFGNRAFWIFVVVFIQIIGPIFYFLLGRHDE